jgi:hypothetical protein
MLQFNPHARKYAYTFAMYTALMYQLRLGMSFEMPIGDVANIV